MLQPKAIWARDKVWTCSQVKRSNFQLHKDSSAYPLLCYLAMESGKSKMGQGGMHTQLDHDQGSPARNHSKKSGSRSGV